MTGLSVAENAINDTIAFIQWSCEVSSAGFDICESGICFTPSPCIGLAVNVAIDFESTLKRVLIIRPSTNYLLGADNRSHILHGLQELYSFRVIFRQWM